jgi:hypothetical protein
VCEFANDGSQRAAIRACKPGILNINNFKIKNHGKSSFKKRERKILKLAAEAKNWTKVIKAVRSPKTGAYTFKEQIVHKDKVKEFLAQK